MLIQTKVGIRDGIYDSSKETILSMTETCLQRLGVDYVDFLLIHRPDALVEPEEVAEAFDKLFSEGKVRHFGVSNHNSYQIELLNKYLGEDNPVCINQLQFSPTNTTMIDAGVNVNMENEGAVNRDGSVLDYCRLKGITIQPWSPFQFGFFNGVFLDNPKFPELNAKINEMAEKYGTTNTGMVVSWILRHPAAMQPIIGTTTIERVQQIAAASDVDITREDWYAIYKAAGNQLP
jgi:predicted oxidoreductase